MLTARIFIRGLTTCLLLITGSLSVNAATKVDNMSGTVGLYNDSNQNCRLIAHGDSGSALVFACDYNPNSLLVEKVPSTTTILLSARDCAESTNGSGWWVKLQATAKSTSTEQLNIKAIVDKAVLWKKDPSSDPYVADNLKIIGAEIRDATHGSGCALLQLPATRPESVVRTLPQPWRATVRGLAKCDNGIIIATYNKSGPSIDSYQCAELQDAYGSAYELENTTHLEIWPTRDVYCPTGTIVTAMDVEVVAGGTHGYIQCSTMKTPKGKTLTISDSRVAKRWVSIYGHINTCESEDYPGPTFLLTAPNQFLTGFTAKGPESRWHCSNATPNR